MWAGNWEMLQKHFRHDASKVVEPVDNAVPFAAAGVNENEVSLSKPHLRAKSKPSSPVKSKPITLIDLLPSELNNLKLRVPKMTSDQLKAELHTYGLSNKRGDNLKVRALKTEVLSLLTDSLRR